MTANDCPDADPKSWFLTHGPRVENDEADRIHEEEDFDFGPSRWKWTKFEITKLVPAREWHLVILEHEQSYC